jgi:hypothetical protein
MPRIPVEAISLLINDHLHEDLTTAKSMSLVCRGLQDDGQGILFRRLKITLCSFKIDDKDEEDEEEEEPPDLIERLENLAAHPLLLSHVRHLELENVKNYNDTVQWLRSHGTLLYTVFDLIQLGQPLQILSIAMKWAYPVAPMFNAGPSVRQGRQFLDKLYDIAAIPTIYALDLVSIPTAILERAPGSLKHLTCRFLFPYETSQYIKLNASNQALANPTAPKFAAKAKLESLKILRSSILTPDWDTLDYFSSASNTNISIEDLREASFLCTNQANWESVCRIIDDCRSSLQALTVKCFS